MADEENLGIAMLATYYVEKGFEVGEIVREPFNIASQAL
jgi:hypothetical protein